MKINTKKCTPVLKDSNVGKMNTNAYIPKDKKEEEDDDSLGREVLYEPELIFTPTMSSKRIEPKPYPRLTEDAVEDLTETISKMLISNKNDDEAKEGEEESPKKSRAKDPIVSKPLGRYEAEVITKSKAVVRVSRSLRLA